MRWSVRCSCVLSAHVALLAGAASTQGVVIDQIDTFGDGSTNNWAIGAAAPQPANIGTGGPAGAGDRFLQLTADGARGGGRLTVFNRDQWLGDYVSAGVTGVRMDLRNFSSTPLRVRIALKQDASAGAPGFATTDGFVLPADGQWHQAVFAISELEMTRLNSADLDFNTLLSNPGEFRILHSLDTSLNGDPIVAQLGVDNIRAIPAPGALAALMLLGMGGANGRRR